MPSIRGSSQFKAIKGITLYGSIGLTGPTGSTGAGSYGPTGATAEKYFTGLTLSGFTLITSFLDGTTVSSGFVYGITGNSPVYMDGKTGSIGDGYIFVGSDPNKRFVEIRKIKGSQGIRSSVGMTADRTSITVTINRYDGGYTLTHGSNSQIIATDGSGNLIGATAAKYGRIDQTVQIRKANVYEKTRGAYTNGGSIENTWTFDETTLILHPYTIANNSIDRNSKAKIYAVDLYSLNSNNITKIIIDEPQPNNPIGFSLYVQGGKMEETYSLPIFSCPEGTSGKVLFPFNTQPCFRDGEKFVIHFISVGNTWYGYVFGKNGGSGNYLCNSSTNLINNKAQKTYDYYEGITGACCKTDGTCEIMPQGLCDGFFSGIGSTCGTLGSTSVCTENLGSCCVKNTVDGKLTTYCIENVSASDCFALNNGIIETVFSGFGKTCVDINCDNCFDQIGACCDGKGNCTQDSKVNCIASGGSFLGRGTLCYTENTNPTCVSGTGACCTPTGVCTSTTAENCISNGGYYFGDGTSCSGVTCHNDLNCCGFLDYTLRPGDLFGGGIVVGVYNPKTSKLLGGKHAFSRHGLTASFMDGGETMSAYYQSEYDYIGYGFTGETCTSILNQENSDSYYIIASLYPVSVDAEGNLVDPTTDSYDTQYFAWYGDGLAWGPILDLNTFTYSDFTFLDKTYDQQYLKYGEGYYGVTGESLENIKDVSFQSCYSSRVNGLDPVARLFAKNVKSSNGIWNRSWGLYNTIRMISADNADYMQMSNSPYFIANDFESGKDITAVRALKLFNNNDYSNSYGLTGNPSQLSDWYLPSHDEMAFIAANCVSDATNPYYGFNLNNELLSNNGVPLYDWHWTSTGSFDPTNGTEGLYISGKPKHGTVAWSMYFDFNGSSENFKVQKQSRDTKLKVRPIRAIRCDGGVPTSTSDAYKLWKTPTLLRNRV